MSTYISEADSVDEIRKRFGLQLEPHWQAYLKFTKEIAQEKLDQDPGFLWRDVEPDEGNIALAAVNKKLHEEGISDQGPELLRWRMPRAIKALKNEKKKKAALDNSVASNPVDSKAERPLPYDPIRDL